MPVTNYLNELNDSQREAVFYVDGPSLVIAGAGSGKTRVLTYKIAYLLEQGYDPSTIMALTFTNKAAREMKERVAQQVSWQQARRLWMGTFHSVFSRILRAEAGVFNYSSRFTIYDQTDSRSLLKHIIKEMKLDDEKAYKPSTVQYRISMAKNALILPEAYAADPSLYAADHKANMPQLRNIYARYWERCRQAMAMDFDDLLLYTYLLFDRHPDICQRYADSFAYILVDEYQDTNYAQSQIVWQLANKHRQLCVVGDDAQSIYSFRGADIGNILRFTKQYAGARLFKLEQNYRSTQTIVNAANSLIAKNREQIHKEVYSENEVGSPITVFEAYSDVEEAERVVSKIVELHRKEQIPYTGFAILYRTNAQSRTFEESLRKRALPYRVVGGLSFYQRKEIKDVIAYFRLVINPNDEEAFRRVVNYPTRGIGDTTVAKLLATAVEHGVSLWTVIGNPDDYPECTLAKRTRDKVEAFRAMIDGFRQQLEKEDAHTLGREIIYQSGIYREVSQDRSLESLAHQENIDELIAGMHDFCQSRLEEGNEHVYLPDYLAEIALLTDQDEDDKETPDKITLMTVHSAKGLEFDTVFIVGLEEDLFPSSLSKTSLRELEEERRLFYVALTRAERHCFLSYARSRYRYGRMEFGNPSCFLREVDEHFLQLPSSIHPRLVPSMGSVPRPTVRPSVDRMVSVGEGQRTGQGSRLRSLRAVQTPVGEASSGTTVPQADGLHVGSRILHERFGQGTIEQLEGTGDNRKVTVQFDHTGRKQLLLKFARFKVIE